MPICATARHKSKLIADFRAVYRSFPDVFRSWDTESLTTLAGTNKRVVRQTLFLTSNYFHNLMLVHASESPDVPVNARGTLEAAHDAIGAFFLLFNLLESEARVWWVFNHRAFLEALCIGNVLVEASKEPVGKELLAKDPLFVRAKADISKWEIFLPQVTNTTILPFHYSQKAMSSPNGHVQCANDKRRGSPDDTDHAADGRGLRGGANQGTGAERVSDLMRWGTSFTATLLRRLFISLSFLFFILQFCRARCWRTYMLILGNLL
jgi:hypothetical protein